MTRYFDYKDEQAEFHDAYYIARKITTSLQSLISNPHLTESEREIIQNYANQANTYLEEIDRLGEIGEIESTINHDMIEPETINYYYEYGDWPENTSETGERFQSLIRYIFMLEEKAVPIVTNLWERTLTPFSNIKNGEPFTVIAHSTTHGIHLDDSFKNNLNSYLSCSIFNTHCMNYYNDPIALTFDITKENYIASSSFDSATSMLSWQDVHTVATMPNGQSIRAGYSYTEDIDKIIIKCENPEDVLTRIQESADYHIINETILNKAKVKPTGLLLFTDGINYLLPYYLIAHEMSKKYDIKIRLIDRTKYHTQTQKDIPLEEFTNQVKQSHYNLWNNQKLTIEEKNQILNNFYQLLIKEQPYSKEKLNICQNELSQFCQALSSTEQTKRI